MQLPDLPEVTQDIVRMIGRQHGLGTTTFSRLPTIGIFNAIYLLGDDLILRVPRQHPAFVAALTKEALAVPAARAAGVRTPRLVIFDDSLTLLPVPYTVYERVRGEPLEQLELDPTTTPNCYRSLGHDLARLHHEVKPHGPIARIGEPSLPQDDPRPLPDQLAAQGYFSVVEARWPEGWLHRLAPETPPPTVFLHGDTQATNMMVDPASLDYLALIDWGSCGWGDPALDFAGMPLRAVPEVLTGYREPGILPDDDTIERRILLIHLHIALITLQRGPQPSHSWGERPMGYLLDVMRFLIDAPRGRWAELLP